MAGLLRRLFNLNERELARLRAVVQRCNALEPETQALSDADLTGRTAVFRERLAKGEPLDGLMAEAFAVAREASRRVLGMRHFDVQLMGAAVLHDGRIAEMKTGEGKTLVAVLAGYLNALPGEGVHVVTVNDYLATRDSEWMGQVYRFLGMDVGLIVNGLDAGQRRRSYAADVTYGTNNEFGFDYLRDNMALYSEEMVQRELNFAIVDEVDSILIDEARTPLIISGMSDKPTELYYRFARVIDGLKAEDDYTVDEKMHTVAPTEEGVHKVEHAIGVENLYAVENMDLSHYLDNALKAKALMHLDRDYIVKDGEVIIVDEFTGRLMIGRRYSDGLHQAIEAKENVKIAQESQTLATITFQNYFRMYRKLSGMTGTAATEEQEFQKIYKLDVVAIPTNLPMVRRDHPDIVYKTEAAKFRAVVREIVERHAKGQPLLVGTVSVENSEKLSRMLEREGIRHQVLNAKYHEREAEIIAQAGRRNSVTIATNMAGRGTDILLGGNPDFLAKQRLRQEGVAEELVWLAGEQGPAPSPEVVELRARYRALVDEFKRETDAEHDAVVTVGGLHIIGTERHESRRIDNQLRGRSGRQGDPGSSRFYLSLADDLMRLFGSDNIKGLMDRLGVEEDEPIEHGLITRAIETAQKRVEMRNFEIRKHVIEYDDVMNQQREVIYGQRRQVLMEESLRPVVLQMAEEEIHGLVEAHCPERAALDEWDVPGLIEAAEQLFLAPGRFRPEDFDGTGNEAIEEMLVDAAREAYDAKEAEIGSETMRELERVVVLRTVDAKWIEHLDAMDDLREGIGLRAYAQQDPLVQYKIEAHEMFHEMIDHVREDVVKVIFHIRLVREEDSLLAEEEPAQHRLERQSVVRGAQEVAPEAEPLRMAAVGGGGPITAGGARRSAPVAQAAPVGDAPRPEPVRVTKVGRNEPCPCGSGKKYKHCHGR